MATKILVIEDEPILVSLYTSVLTRAMYDVSTAMDAESGEEKVIVIRPHVVLLDLLIPKLPGGDTHGEDYHEPTGFQILRLVKSTPSLRETRVIVLSNLDSDEHVATAKKLGADDYIVKSNMDPHSLAGHVERVLQTNRPTVVIE